MCFLENAQKGMKIIMKNKRRYRSITKRSYVAKNNKLYIIIFSCIIIFIIGALFIKLGIDERKNVEPEYSYSGEKSSSYEVLLKPNDFYESQSLPSSLYYASKSIDNFVINFKYDFNGSKETNLSYSYNVTAELIGYANDKSGQSRKVWSKTFDIAENKDIQQNYIKDFSISQDANINYETYNNLARLYEDKYGITIDAILKVRLNVSLNFYDLEKKEAKDYIELDIQINSTITNVEEKYESKSLDNIGIQGKTFNTKEILYSIIGVIFILASIAITIIAIKKSKSEESLEDMYEKNINKILKYYRDLIVTVDNKPDLSNLESLKVMILDDLIDVAEQNKAIIIRYEELKEDKSYLYVIIGKYAYIYEVTADELK